MSLLRDIQSATTNPSFKLADILRKAKILAARLEHQPFKDWIEKELNGYNSSDNIPPYRILTNLNSRGDFCGSFGSALKKAPIPLLNLPKEFYERLTQAYIVEGVGAIENTVEQANKASTGLLGNPWPSDVVALLSREFYEDMTCLQAWRDIPVNNYVSILDTVKNKILDFSLEIEAKAPEAGEVEPGKKPISEEDLNTIFQHCVFNFAEKNMTSMESKENTYNQNGNFGIGHMSGGEIQKEAKVAGVINEAEQQNLTHAAEEIQQLLKQLSQTHPTETLSQKAVVAEKAIKQIENNPSLKERVVNAIKAMGVEALMEAIDHPIANVLRAGIEGNRSLPPKKAKENRCERHPHI